MAERDILLGVDLGGSKIEAVAMDADGVEFARRRAPTPRDDYSATVAAIAALIRAVADEGGAAADAPVGVGIPGSLSPATGLVRNANSTWLNGKPLARDLARAAQRPVFIENDANCFALSEAADGAARGHESAFGVIIGTGVGGGLVSGGRLVAGANRIAGEWGHNPLPWPEAGEWPGPECWCGKRGCVETFLSGPAFERDFAASAGRRLAAADIAAAARAGDAQAGAALARYQDRMARALAAVVNIFDPEVVVFGGGLSNIGEILSGAAERLPRWAFADALRTPLLANLHGDSSGVRGAARFCLSASCAK